MLLKRKYLEESIFIWNILYPYGLFINEKEETIWMQRQDYVKSLQKERA